MNTHNFPHHHPQREEMMMMKGLMVDHDNMSNLTSSSAEISASSSIRKESAAGSNLNYNQHSSASTNQLPPPPKRKRNLPGNPDPDAEVIALSPTTLVATNRFICEICNKGFQRDQNLQLHRRGHNLPWKLKQRTNKEVIRKKVYVCPESTCVHHDPSRALGDLTGIKKHFFRKHGEKKWKCEKCSKIYAVKSDWKAHSKICGTREYRCDCGTIFSRRDSFITHRAFCDALAQETSGRGITPIINHHPLLIPSQPRLHSHGLQASSSSVKREQEFVPWLTPNLSSPPPPLLFSSSSSSSSTSSILEHSFIHHQNPNPSSTTRLVPPIATATASPHTSATALLQRATKMGAATMSKASPFLPPHQPAAPISGIMEEGWFGNIKATPNPNSASLLHDMMSSLSSEAGLAVAAPSYSYGDASNTAGSFVEIPPNNTTSETQLQSIGVGGGDGGNEGLTRDFLGLRAFPQRDFFDIVGLHHINNSSSSAYGEPQNHNQSQWHG